MHPWDMDERPVPPDPQPPSWYERLAPYGIGAAVLIAVIVFLALIERSGIGLAFVLFLGTIVALSAGAVWLLLTCLDWLGWPLALQGRDVATRAVFVLGMVSLLVLGVSGRFALPERAQLLDSQGPSPSAPLDQRVLMLLVVPTVVALMLGVLGLTEPRRQWPVMGAGAGLMLAIGMAWVWLAVLLLVLLVLALLRPLSWWWRG
ncbi:MAG: hypothetical protein CL878_01280 [Dehalococcoidia bacterium]|nr:hypothetical protein [Dehalococcoidia bacterium]